MFSKRELSRYSRHFNLPGFDMETQAKLKSARVLVVGAGGLGCPLLLYLAAAGVGHIGIIDMDRVDLTNLHRQVLYRHKDIGKFKAAVAAQRLELLNPDIKVKSYPYSLTTENALTLVSDYDIVVDGTDNFPTRYLVNDACVLAEKMNVYASIFRFEGQVSVFNYAHPDGTKGPNYRDLYPTPPPPGLVPDCATGGVLGVLPGIVGSLQALEVIKILTGLGNPLVGKLLIYDALSSNSRIVKFGNKTSVRITELINYDQFCNGETYNINKMGAIREITVQDLKTWRDTNKDFQLIDVREKKEWDFVNIAGDLIPMGEVMANLDKIQRDKDVVVLCRTGKRSSAIIHALQKRGYSNLYNLKGGIKAWAEEIDTSLPTY